MRRKYKGPQLLRKWRTDRDLLLRDIAEDFGVTIQAVSEWERGTRTPRLPTLIKMHELGIVDIQEWVI